MFRVNRPINPDKQFGDFKMRTRLRYFDEKIIAEEMRDFYRIPEKLEIVLDVGSNIGYTSLLCAKKGALVYAFEPEAYNYETLVYNVNLNGFQDKIKCINLGVGFLGRVRLYLHRNMSGTNSTFLEQKGLYEDKYQEIESITIKDVFSNYNITHCSLLKLDCEGSEYDIINDIDDYLADKIDQISVEFHSKAKMPQLINKLLKWYKLEYNYKYIYVFKKK